MAVTLPASNDDRAIWDIWQAQYRLPLTSVHDAVGTFRTLSDHAMDTVSLATNLSLDERALGIHLSALAAMNLVERRGGKWRATDVVRRWLHPEADGYYGAMINRYAISNPLHEQLLETLKTGGKASTHVSAAEEWERGEMPADMAKYITAFMHAHSRATALGAAQQGAFAAHRRLLDVGGGSGIYCIEIASANPTIKASVMDIAAICEEAQSYIEAAGMEGQVDTRPTDMFRQAWPTGYDAHFFSNIFHDWSAETNLTLARKSFAALEPGGRIYLSEMLMDDDLCGPWHTAAFSLMMLLGTRGKQYSFPELRDILETAGFTDIDSVRTGGGYYSLVSGRKP